MNVNEMFGSQKFGQMHRENMAEAARRGITIEELVAEKIKTQLQHRRAIKAARQPQQH